MGFRYRKSIRLGGGFRVNLSTKGIGYSWGTKGYRVTKTADGRTRQTVSIPGTGISYVDEHGPRRGSSGTAAQPQPVDPYEGYTNVEQVKSADINTLSSDAYAELIKQVTKIKTVQGFAIILTLLSAVVAQWFFYLCVAACIALFVIYRCDVEYEFDDIEQAKWDKLSAVWRSVASSQSLQEITTYANAKNAKTNAGIQRSIETVKMKAGNKLPFYIRTNVKPVVFSLKECQVAIMPDRLFVFGKKKLAVIDYDDVKVNISAIGFLEQGPAPKDAEFIQNVWAYANVDGSPDKRYANNRQFPVFKYGKIELKSASGLNVQFLCSNEKASDALYHTLNP